MRVKTYKKNMNAVILVKLSENVSTKHQVKGIGDLKWSKCEYNKYMLTHAS